MGVLAGLASLGCLSLFLAWLLRRSASLMPLLAASLCILFFTLAGVFGQLVAAGYLWYALCLGAAGWVVVKEKKNTLALISPGLLVFLVGGALFVLLFATTGPLLTHWDEFTFWGTASKVTSTQHQLYTTAHSNLIARSYPPGLIVFGYMMQFFGGFSEPGLVAAFAIFHLACLVPALALWDKHPTAAVAFFAALLLMPLFFSVNQPMGQMQWSYLAVMSDTPMGLMFGGALCFYLGWKGRGGRLFLAFGLVLAALVCIKDMGLALAAVALFVALADALLCEGKRLAFNRLRGWKAALAAFALCAALMAGAYLVWAWHQQAALKNDRFDFGSQGQTLSPVSMVVAGSQMLLGFGRSEQFSHVLGEMVAAFFKRPVSLLGPGVVVLGLILMLAAAAWLLAATKRQQLRVLVFTLAMAFGFVGFYIFNIFTYTFVFKGQEALQLKDYQRYIAPYWTAWLMGTLVVLGRTAVDAKASYVRLRIARGASAAASMVLAAAVLLLGNWQGNFLRVSPSLHSIRLNVNAVVDTAVAQGMKKGDVVYLISQGDDGTRFYMFGYQMPADRALVFDGYLIDISGKLVLDEADQPILHGNVAGTLMAPGTPYPPAFGAAGTREDILAFIKQEGCTHLLVDVPDDYIMEELGPLFEDELVGWSSRDATAVGHRYYRIEWDKQGQCRFVPETEGRGGL